MAPSSGDVPEVLPAEEQEAALAAHDAGSWAAHFKETP